MQLTLLSEVVKWSDVYTSYIRPHDTLYKLLLCLVSALQCASLYYQFYLLLSVQLHNSSNARTTYKSVVSATVIFREVLHDS